MLNNKINMKHEHHSQNHEHNHRIKLQEESLDEKELRSWKRRLLGAWALTIPIVLLMYVPKLFGFMLFEDKIMTLIILIIAFPVIFFFGFETLKGGLRG